MAAGLAALGPWMLGSTAISTAGSLIGGGGGGAPQQADYSSLYAQLAPINQRITYAGQELMANMAPYIGAEAAKTQLGQQTMYDIASGATSREKQLTGLQTGIASQLAGAAIGQQEMAAKGRTAMELLGGETQAKMAEKGADVLGLQFTNLAKGLTDVGTSAANVRNQQVLAQTQANLETGKMLAGIKGQTESQMALRRQAAGMALTPRFA